MFVLGIPIGTIILTVYFIVSEDSIDIYKIIYKSEF